MTVRDDRAFLDLLAAGDAECLAAACEHFGEWLVAFVAQNLRRELRRRVDAADLAQQAMISFVLQMREGSYSFEHLAGVKHLLAVFAMDQLSHARRDHHRECRDIARESSLDSDTDNSDCGNAPQPIDGHGDPFAAAVAADLLEHILNGLPPHDRRIIELRIEGYTTKEIAAKVHCSRSHVTQVLRRAVSRVTG
jgi:RNA polymerase sigma factor (sigma-70 family)